jgi:hypothetical protein
MPRKPNYRFDRMEKDRVKAAKKAERLKAKQDRSTSRQSPDGQDLPEGDETPEGQEPVDGAEPDAGAQPPRPAGGEA